MAQILPVVFFSSEKEIFSWTYLLKKTPEEIKYWYLQFEIISKDLRHTFWAHTNMITVQQNLFLNFFLPQEAGAFGNNIKKERQKPRPSLQKYVYKILTENICSTCSPMQVAVYYKHVLILWNSDSDFLSFKVT